MKYFNMNPVYTVVDIGTTKIIVLIAEIVKSEIKILGIGMAESFGLEKGIVTNIEKTKYSIKKALEDAILQSHIKPESVYIGISGNHIKSYFSLGMASISKDGITQKVITEAILASQSIILPEGEKIVHTLPLNYVIDNNCIVQYPLGMHGMRLEVNSHIITANKNAIEDLVACCSFLGLKVKDIILEPIASAEAILNEEEKKFGSLIVDIGGGTSDVVLYKNNTIEYIEIIPIAGRLFTDDLAICLQAKAHDAEELKKTYGLEKFTDQDSVLIYDIDMLHERYIQIDLINRILEARAEELISCIENIITKYQAYHYLPAGIVITGGGSMMKGLDSMISRYTSINCRVGLPRIENETYLVLKNPIYSTVYGLLKYVIKNDIRFQYDGGDISFFKSIKKWINNYLEV